MLHVRVYLSVFILGKVGCGIARICCEEGQRWKLCHGHSTVDSRAVCSSYSIMTNSFATNAVLIERAVSC